MTQAPDKDVSLPKADAARWIKTAACATFFVAAAAYFSLVSAKLMDDYAMVLVPTKELTVPWLVRACIAAFLMLLMFGATVTLIRPPSVAAATYLVGMILYALIMGGAAAAWAVAAAGSVFLAAFAYSTVRLLENQVEFSVRPVRDRVMGLCTLLALLLAVPAGLGYVRDSAHGGYLIPPQITVKVRKQADEYVTKMVDGQHLAEPQRTLVLLASQEQMGTWMDDAEKKAEPYKDYVPFLLGLAAYFTFQVLLYVPAAAAVALLGLLVAVLKVTGFARLSTQERTVSRLTL
ncbi:MAG: hypothetical protein RL272_938 [Candidatus Parcubacteria bacterium]|jgi:hypothetical protein